MELADEPQGCQFYFFILQAINFLLVIFGIILIIASLCILMTLHTLTYLDLTIFIIGAFIALLAYALFHMKHSYTAMSCYVMLIMAFLIVVLFFVVLVAAAPEKVINLIEAELNEEDKEQIRTIVMAHLKLVQYFLFALAVVTVTLLCAEDK